MNCYSIRAGVGRWVLMGLVGGLSLSDGGAIEKVEAPLNQPVEGENVTDAVAPADGPREGVSGPQERSRLGEIVKLGGEVLIARGEEARDVVIVFGSARVEGYVRGDMVVVGGSAHVDGVIKGNLVVPLGKLTLGPDAEVEGDLVVVLGELNADPGAMIGGERFELTLSALEEHLPPMTGLRRWVMEGVILGRLLPHQPGWWWWFASACAILLVVTALIFPRPVAYGVNALETRPVGSFFLGLLVFLLFGPLLLLLVATGVGILVVPFVLCGGCVAYLLGKAAVYQYLGRQVGRQTGLAFLQLPLLALLLGIALFYGMYVIPVVGMLAWFLAGLLGLGAVVLAFFDAFRADDAAPVRMAAVPPVFALPTGGGHGVSAPPLIPGQPPVRPAVEPGSLARVGFWMRFLATFIDLLLVGALTSMTERGGWFLPLWMAYHIGFWAWRGTTVGGVVMGLKIVRADGREIDFPIALIRSLSSFLSALALFIGFFWAGWTRERVAWHDQIAGTIVVKMPRGVPLF